MTFDGAALPEPIILRHMLAKVNTHIDLDLGISVQQVAPAPNCPAARGFQQIDAVLASQVNGVVEDIDETHPRWPTLPVLMQHQIFVIDQVVRTARDSAWRSRRV